MSTPHKHAELIKKWAYNTELLFQYKVGGDWKDSGNPPAWLDNLEYRIKLETIRYRVALMSTNNRIYTITVDNKYEAAEEMSNDGFVKWLTDWIEVEI
jgi:hypothetical protein